MFVPFESLPDTSRIWVYQADRSLSTEQQDQISVEARQFLSEWAAHGAPLESSFRISHDQFLIIGVNENRNAVSGCSTDAQVRFVQLIQSKLGVNFFDRSLVAIMEENEISLISLNELKTKQASVEENTVTFNNLINTKGQLHSEWMQPAGNTWLARYI